MVCVRLCAVKGIASTPDHSDHIGKQPETFVANIILASSSPYRAALLARLGLAFESVAPNINESVHPEEAAEDYVCRLAREKAAAVALDRDDAIIIASDQCCEVAGKIMGKPGNQAAAIDQLLNASGQRVILSTAVAVYDPHSRHTRVAHVPASVYFRRLTRQAIERYVAAENPIDCAGAFKVEGLGITLFERIDTEDPNAIIGLPLIALTRLLGQLGINLP